MSDAQFAEYVAAKATRKRRRKIDAWIMDTLGNEWCGSGGPPLDHRSVYVYDDGVHRVFSSLNDGHEVGIGYPNEWHVIMRKKAVRMLAWWTFKLWVTDWFGLRSAIWYRALHHKVKGEWKLRPYPNRHRRLTRWSSHDEWWNGPEGQEIAAMNRAKFEAEKSARIDGTGHAS